MFGQTRLIFLRYRLLKLRIKKIEIQSLWIYFECSSVGTGQSLICNNVQFFSASLYVLRKFYGCPMIVKCVNLLFKYLFYYEFYRNFFF